MTLLLILAVTALFFALFALFAIIQTTMTGSSVTMSSTIPDSSATIAATGSTETALAVAVKVGESRLPKSNDLINLTNQFNQSGNAFYAANMCSDTSGKGTRKTVLVLYQTDAAEECLQVAELNNGFLIKTPITKKCQMLSEYS